MASKTVNNKTHLDYVAELEAKNPSIVTESVAGMHIWPILKSFTSKQMVRGQSSQVNVDISSIARLKLQHLKHNLKDGKSIFFPDRKEVLLFGNNSTKSLFNGKYFDYLLQPLATEDSILLESSYNRKGARSMRSFSTSIFEELSLICTKALLPFLRGKLFGKLEQKYEFLKSKSAQSYVLNTLILSYFYYFLLKIIRPKKVFLVCYYSLTGYAMTYAAKRYGATVHDVQHGNLYQNYAYYGWKLAPKNGYNTVPDAFLTWSKVDEEIITKNCSKKFLQHHKPSVHGLPWLGFWKKNSPESKSYINTLKSRAKGYKKIALITLRHSLFTSGEWSALNEVISDNSDVFWYIRKHPTMNENYHSKDESLNKILNYKQNNVEYTLASNVPLYALLRVSDVHITTGSSAAQEAMEFGVPTIFLSSLGEDEMPHIFHADSNILASDAKSLRKALSALKK